jgi:hypothetical protein
MGMHSALTALLMGGDEKMFPRKVIGADPDG